MRLPANTIRAHRLSRGWSLQKLADVCQTSKSQIDKLERGQRRLAVEWMVRLAKALECDPRDLLGMPASAHAAARRAKSAHPLPMRAYRGPSGGSGKNGGLGDPVGGVPCPFFLAPIPGAYALYVQSDSMRPMFRSGQILFMDPRKRPTEDMGVLVVKKDGTALLAAFVGCEKGRMRLRTFSPKSRTQSVLEADVAALHAVVGSMES